MMIQSEERTFHKQTARIVINIPVRYFLLSAKVVDGELSWKGQPADYRNTNSHQSSGDDELLLKCRFDFFHGLDLKEVSGKECGDQADNDPNRAHKQWVAHPSEIMVNSKR